MSNDNRSRLKAHHNQHSNNQQPKRKRSFIDFISIVACLIMLLLIASCQPVYPQTFTKLDSINDTLAMTAYVKEVDK